MSAPHNGGPPPFPLNAKAKLECIRGILERQDLSAAQKCVGTCMILEADKEWSAAVKTEELRRAASVKDRETVFRATKKLDEVGVISKASGRGQAGKYVVLPPRVLDAVVEAFNDMKSGRDNTDQSTEKQSGETGRHNQSNATGNAVGFEPTTRGKSGRTSPVSPDQSKTSPAPARAEDNINIYNNYNNLPTKPNPIQSNKIPNTAREYEAFAKTLTETCNGALDNPANCQGLAGLATPIMWLREGCDLELDILPTLHGYGKSAHGKKIRSWDYFTKGVQKARDARLQGLPIEPVSRDAGKNRAPSADDTIRQIDAIVRGGR